CRVLSIGRRAHLCDFIASIGGWPFPSAGRFGSASRVVAGLRFGDGRKRVVALEKVTVSKNGCGRNSRCGYGGNRFRSGLPTVGNQSLGCSRYQANSVRKIEKFFLQTAHSAYLCYRGRSSHHYCQNPAPCCPIWLHVRPVLARSNGYHRVENEICAQAEPHLLVQSRGQRLIPKVFCPPHFDSLVSHRPVW